MHQLQPAILIHFFTNVATLGNDMSNQVRLILLSNQLQINNCVFSLYWEGANRRLRRAGCEHGEISTCTGESRRLYSQKGEQHDTLVNSISVLRRCSCMCFLSFRNSAHAVTAGVLARGCSQTSLPGKAAS